LNKELSKGLSISETDKEIIDILKELIRKKKPNESIDPDDLLAEQLLKTFALLSIIALIVSLIGKIFAPDELNIDFISSTVFTLFFMMLFMHLNNKSKNPSLILYGLTFISTMIPIWLS